MRILIIEDDRRISSSLKKGFKQEAYVVDVASDGETGYDLAISEDYDVIILDLNLPRISGETICKHLREESVSTPIIVLTARGEVEDRIQGLNAGADDYLPKPFSFEELLARVRALARRPKKLVRNKLSIADLTLNVTTFEVKRGETKIPLSRTEFSLLEYLLRNKGRILSKRNIIEHVWNFDADVLPNTVEAYIGYLRKKIDDPFPKNRALLHTIRGFGYKLDIEK